MQYEDDIVTTAQTNSIPQTTPAETAHKTKPPAQVSLRLLFIFRPI